MFDTLVRYPLPSLRSYALQRGLTLPRGISRQAAAAALIYAVAMAKAEQVVAAGERSYDAQDDTYPAIMRALRILGARRVLDLGCGPGVFAQALREGHPGLERYHGVEVVKGLVTQARRRFKGSPRYAFQHCDVRQKLPALRWRPEAIVLSFFLSYLDTRTADQLLGAVHRAWPGASLVIALTFHACADLRPGVAPEGARALGRGALRGDATAVAAWDTTRLGSYLRALVDRYGLQTEELLPGGERFLWVAQPR